MDPFLRRVLEHAQALGLPFYVRWGIVLLLALLEVAGEEAWKGLGRIDWPSPEPAPLPLSDGGVAGDRDIPPAQEVTAPIRGAEDDTKGAG